MNLTYTVSDVLKVSLSKLGVDYNTTDPKNIEDAHRNLNIMLGGWSADPDLNVGRLFPVSGYTNLTDSVDLPIEYITAIIPNLKNLLAADYDQKVSAADQLAADNALNAIKIFNVRRIAGSIPTNRR